MIIVIGIIISILMVLVVLFNMAVVWAKTEELKKTAPKST